MTLHEFFLVRGLNIYIAVYTPFQINPNYFEKPVRDIRQFVRKEIENHRDDYDPENIRDLVDLYLQADENGSEDLEGIDGKCLLQSSEDKTFEQLQALFLPIVSKIN